MGSILCLGLEVAASFTINTAIVRAIAPRTAVGAVCAAAGGAIVSFITAPYIHDATVRALSPYVDVTK